MKKALALILALMLLMLVACGQGAEQSGESKPAQDQNSAAEAGSETTGDGYYVSEEVREDGSKLTVYRNGGPEGAVVKAVVDYPDGSHHEETYNADGNLTSMSGKEADGTVYECTFYPSGYPHTDIYRYADGSYEEIHYLDDGSIDPETGWITSGTIIYEKRVSADGKVEEFSYDITKEEDGTWWNEEELEDGTTIKTHYSANGLPMKQISDNPATGMHVETEFYESGNMKSQTHTRGDSEGYNYMEYYDGGDVKYRYIQQEGDSFIEENISELGYSTYLHIKSPTVDREFFADENGNLLKCISDGTPYEGDAISATDKDMFDRMMSKPPATADDTVTTENDDGTRLTTTTYSDGKVVKELRAADGRLISQDTMQANGEGYYFEYFESGKLKIEIYTNPGAVHTRHYDEDGYLTYFKEDFGTYVTEITTDENGKVDKVTVNGVPQTDVSAWKGFWNFRSW